MTGSTEGETVVRSGQSQLERYVAGVRFVAPIMPATASGAMFIAYLLPAPLGRDAASSVLIGIAAALLVALLGGAIAIPFMRGRDRSRSFLELWERYQRLEARLEVARTAKKSPANADEAATAQLAISDVERIVARLKRSLDDGDPPGGSAADATQPPGGEDGSSGVGLVGLWQLIHAGEEALLLVEPMTEVIAQALLDRRRLVGSTIPQAPALLAMQGAAVRGLDKAIAETYFAATTESLGGGPGK
jgi:hypothetical protein